jgi:Hydrolase of X-linked nucleoside diphosphate N terminal
LAAVRRTGITLPALAQDGLTYAAEDHDRDRYQQLGRLAAELRSVRSGRPAEDLAVGLGRDFDVRGVISTTRNACC